MMKFIFGMQINTKVCYNVILSLWVCVARHAQNTQNNKFVISLQYFKENLKDEVAFWLQVKTKGFFRLIVSFYVCVARHAQITKNTKFAISSQYLKKVSDEVDFCMQISLKFFHKLML